MRGPNTKGGIGRCHKINVKAPNKDLGLDCARGGGAVHIHEPLSLACRRRIACPEAGWNQAVLIAQVGRQNGEPDRVSRAAIDHAVAIKRIHTNTIESRGIGKLVHRQIIGVRPQAKFWIVAKVVVMRWIDLHGVQPPAAGNRITCLADTNALIKRSAGKCGKCKVADHPPVSHMVIENYPVAVIFIVAAGITAAQPGKE